MVIRQAIFIGSLKFSDLLQERFGIVTKARENVQQKFEIIFINHLTWIRKQTKMTRKKINENLSICQLIIPFLVSSTRHQLKRDILQDISRAQITSWQLGLFYSVN